MKPDARSMRIALTADPYVNPPPGGLDGLAILAAAGWGVMQLPAAEYPPGTAARMLAEVAEQVQEFSRNDYELVVVGDCAGLAGALAAVGLPLPDQIIPATAAELRGFLESRPAPAAEHWARLAAGRAAPAGGPQPAGGAQPAGTQPEA